MRLLNFQVNYYKCISDSGIININDIACFIGNNNSGKTALFEALYKLNPAFSKNKFFESDDFPKDKIEYQNSKTRVITCTFKLTDAELIFINKKFGDHCINSDIITVSRDYANNLHWDFEINEESYVKHLIDKRNLTKLFEKHLSKINSVESCYSVAKELPPLSTSLVSFITQLELLKIRSMKEEIIEGYFQHWIPKFLYISEVHKLPGYFSLKQITKALSSSDDVKEAAKTALAFLKLLEVDINSLLTEPDNNKLLETMNNLSSNLSSHLSSILQIFEHLQIDIDIQSLVAQNVRIDSTIYINITNKETKITLPIGKHGKSLVYFLSFLCSLSIIKDKTEPYIILIDTPSDHLSIDAQSEFCKYIHDVLTQKHQILYTTHSPFMINTKAKDNLYSVFIKPNFGTVVSQDVNSDSLTKKISDIADKFYSK
ncbi:MAG: hypothetical protein A2Y40_08420 [Candidatus Margulisbacteria bacterium GWF2_35_9]|nr:MAG: hypothetical protein A2Y40_08420 [Candidatus Margulisbacteria bacterium GWF2_35_9]